MIRVTAKHILTGRYLEDAKPKPRRQKLSRRCVRAECRRWYKPCLGTQKFCSKTCWYVHKRRTP
jgi:hypothetical protein